MSDFAVSTVFDVKDRVSASLKKIGAGTDKFGTKSGKAFDKANRKALSFKTTLGAILSARILARGTALMAQGIRSVTGELISFDDAITKAGAKFPVTAKRGTKAFKELEKEARRVGATTKFSATEAAQGLDFLAMAGFDQAQAMKALAPVTDLAVVADADLSRATDIASDALGSFNLMTKDSVKLTENLTRINDVFAKTVTSANTDIENLFEAMKDGGPVMTAAGSDIETFAALSGKMADAAIKGSKAGTTLKNMFLNLQAPVPKAAKLIKKLGLELVGEDGKLRDIVDILGDFNKKTAKMGKAQKSAAVNTIFGKRAIAGVSVLLAEGADSLREYRQTLIDSGGSAKDMADTIGKSLGNRLKALKSSALEVGFKFFDVFKEKIPGAIDTAIEAVREFDVKPVIKSVKDFAFEVKNVWQLLKDLRPIIETAALLWISYTVALKAVIAIRSVVAFWKLTAALKAAGGAQSFLNAAMLANPIGLVALAVGGLATAGFLLFKQWDNIKVLWNLLVSDMKDGIRKATRAFKNSDFGKFIISTIDSIIEKWKWVQKNVFRQKVGAEKEVSPRAALRQARFDKGKEDSRRRLAEARAGRGEVAGFTKLAKGQRGLETLAGGRAPRGRRGLTGKEREPARIPPNREDVAAQSIAFKGAIDISGAPPGTTVESKTTGAPPIDMNLIGFNI